MIARRRVSTVFVDRDGVINTNRSDYVTAWDHFEFLPGALAGLELLAAQGLRIIVVTNQSVVNRGLASQDEIDGLHARMLDVVTSHGGRIEAVFSCPHRPDEGCVCRKPEPGLLVEAAHKLGILLQEAILIGDHPTDLEAARRAGCASILVLSGRTVSWPSDDALPEGCVVVLPDLLTAARHIVNGMSVLRSAAAAGPEPKGRKVSRWYILSRPQGGEW
jgi:D-glycero-D-manno-heptose 1,7-bisphosphate phosphatase